MGLFQLWMGSPIPSCPGAQRSSRAKMAATESYRARVAAGVSMGQENICSLTLVASVGLMGLLAGSKQMRPCLSLQLGKGHRILWSGPPCSPPSHYPVLPLPCLAPPIPHPNNPCLSLNVPAVTPPGAEGPVPTGAGLRTGGTPIPPVVKSPAEFLRQLVPAL